MLVAPDLAVDAVTLVAVENLMVGVEAQFQVVVHEPLVQGRRQRPHDGLSAADLVENIFETLDLRLVLRKYIGIVTPQRTPDHVVGQHLEIFIEFRLGRRRELHRCGRGPLGKIVAQQENLASGKVGHERVAARQQRVDLIGMLHVRERPAADVVDPPQHEIGVVEPPGGIRTGETRQRNLRRGRHPGIQVGDDLHAVQLAVNVAHGKE